KPMAILNTNGYFDSLFAWINRAFSDGFIYDEHLQLFVSDSHPAGLLTKLENYQFPENIGRWLEREE
ncbi:MAG: LOG family protein, partial [Anaerolineaceae bacterium]|nr:LOG family protein [Anaerolineaceae bacterium]